MLRRINAYIKSQKGFTLVELMIVISILGILAAIAVPKFSNSTDSANTARIASDLRTIDSAIAIYYFERGTYPPTVNYLVTYKYLASTPTPPKGKAYLDGSNTATTIAETSYTIDTTTNRAQLAEGKYAENYRR